MVGIGTDTSKAFAEQLSEIGETVSRPTSSPALTLITPNWERLDPPWWLVRAGVHACVGVTDDGVGTYCILARLDARSYVQTAFAPRRCYALLLRAAKWTSIRTENTTKCKPAKVSGNRS